ncbi:hypothetical protein B2J93_7175 [Marssonina coronariae]|uniref:RNA helicase n=1 Tax=Diplocarpon coronariae TaxID=2795749 RepID=A0A218Z516_9HELO|nr:hypothetical protein JHW43_006378 [Diplocarpon mali]OWP03149.1 hypothetical protein B2J93_7175 [Marssonina coronariae]
MPLATRRGALSAFCIFRASRSLHPPFQRHNVLRYSTGSSLKITRTASEYSEDVAKNQTGNGSSRHHKNPSPPKVSRSKLRQRSKEDPTRNAQAHQVISTHNSRSFAAQKKHAKPPPGWAPRSKQGVNPRSGDDGSAREKLEQSKYRGASSLPRPDSGSPANPSGPQSEERNIPKSKSDGVFYDPVSGGGLGSQVNRQKNQTETTYGVFGRLLLEQAQQLRWTLSTKENLSVQAWGMKTDDELDQKMHKFEKKLLNCTKMAEDGKVSQENNPLFFNLRRAFIEGTTVGLAEQLKASFISEMFEARFPDHDKNTNQQKLADLRYPLEWFPATRALQRTVHLHIGPTNSGKTYHALQRLEAAETGIYAGPLRLLAHEVYTRMNAKGKACALITGEERRIPENLDKVMNSCTVEMVPLNAQVDVAVIDEIQMMADQVRGWAWTQAFLGVQAKEVHLCGEVRTKDIITDLCAAMGDKLVVHEYKRLSPLKTMSYSLNGDLKNLQKGDAVILFSRLEIHAMKRKIEKATQKRCAVVYGSLPPETRAQQAALFNDPDNDYDYLAASDAVGMGLNLSIKRVIFETTSKHDGTKHRLMAPYEIKQIAGRAGRFKTAQDAISQGKDAANGVSPLGVDVAKKPVTSEGLVTTLEKFDLPIVRRSMNTDVPPIKTAGVFPPTDILLRFASYFPPKTPFSYIVLRLHGMAALAPQFHICDLKDQIRIADIIQKLEISHMDRITMMSAPINLKDSGTKDVIFEMAKCIAEQRNAALLDLKCFKFELLDQDIHQHPHGSKGYLKEAEAFHRWITLYLWLSYRFAGVFISQALAFHVKGLVEQKIDECLAEVDWDDAARRKITYLRQKSIRESLEENHVLTEAEMQNDKIRQTLSVVGETGAQASSPEDEQETRIEEDEEDDVIMDEAPEGQYIHGEQHDVRKEALDDSEPERHTRGTEEDIMNEEEEARHSCDTPDPDGNASVILEQTVANDRAEVDAQER